MMQYFPETMNIELTTKCPLRCPQCYCTLEGGKNINPDTAVNMIREGGELGVREVMLSGGETLCYPDIYEVIKAANKYCGSSNISLSGSYLSDDILDRLIESGISRIYISLNGSTEEINSQTRDGYSLAIKALKLLQDRHFEHTVINWVMHSNNAHDFPEMIRLAESYGVMGLAILGLKPDANNKMVTVPSLEQMIKVKEEIRAYKGKTKIWTESCYSPMLALIGDTKLFGNLNVGKHNGCLAGRNTVSVSVDGLFSPCRHLMYYEEANSLKEYWYNSPVLQKIRMLQDSEAEDTCSSCHFSRYCRPCFAVSAATEGSLKKCNSFCPLSSFHS